MKLTAAYKKL